MATCTAPGGCGAEVAPGSALCTVHGAGYQRAAAGSFLRCTRCGVMFKKGEWMRVATGSRVHAHPCQRKNPRR